MAGSISSTYAASRYLLVFVFILVEILIKFSNSLDEKNNSLQ